MRFQYTALNKQYNNFMWAVIIMNSEYGIIIFWSKDDVAFIAEVPELAGCMSDGKTYQEALTNVQRAIEEWVETAEDLEREIPVPKGRLKYA